jgi:hypothetical protein
MKICAKNEKISPEYYGEEQNQLQGQNLTPENTREMPGIFKDCSAA